MVGTAVSHPDVYKFDSPYSAARRMGRMLFISGAIPLDAEGKLVGAGDAAAQTRQVLLNIQRLLAAAGGGFEHVAQLTYYLADMSDWPAMRGPRDEFLVEPYPAASTLEVSRLVSSEWLIEIEAIAILPEVGLDP
jgi:reactive intermediate/imine deaminase